MKKGEFGKRRIRTLVDRIISFIHECYSLRTVQLQMQFYTVQRDQMNITWVCVTDRPGSFTSQSQCTPSPVFWLNKPAPHEHPHQAGYIITHLTSLQGPVSFIHWASYLPVYYFCVSSSLFSCVPSQCLLRLSSPHENYHYSSKRCVCFLVSIPRSPVNQENKVIVTSMQELFHCPWYSPAITLCFSYRQ